MNARGANQAMIGLLDQMSSGGGVELCAPLIEKYQSIHNAPKYDMNGQSSAMQQAYAAYRQGIALADTRAGTILGCGQGSGPMGGMELGFVRQTVSRAGNLFGQALDWTKRAVTISAESSLPDAVNRVRTAVSQIDLAFQRVGVGGTEPCEPFVDEYNVLVNAPTYDVGGKPANVQNAYGLYRRAIELALAKASPVAEMCGRGGGILGKLDFATAGPVLKQAGSLLNQALSALGQ